MSDKTTPNSISAGDWKGKVARGGEGKEGRLSSSEILYTTGYIIGRSLS